MKENINTCDVDGWLYSEIVKDHFFNPRNILLDEKDYVADGVGVSGNMACGDMMAIWIRVNEKSKKIDECKWRTFGCASAIASMSMLSIIVTENGGMLLAHAKKIQPEAIIERLGGLPDRKYHCSVLGHDALRDAIQNYEKDNNENK